MKKIIYVAILLALFLASCGVSGATTSGMVKDVPVIHSFTADPANIAAGEGTQISWQVSNATSVVINNGIGQVALSGSFAICPTGSVSYKITATNAAGPKSALVNITVHNQGEPQAGTVPKAQATSSLYKPVISDFYSIPSIILSGEKSTLNWTVENADTVIIDRGIGTVANSGLKNVKPTETTIYTLTASNKAGSASATTSVKIDALPAVPVISEFSSTPSTIVLGRSSMLKWNVTNAAFVRISGIGNVADAGTMYVYPGSTIIYTLVATNAGGNSQSTCQVTVEEAP